MARAVVGSYWRRFPPGATKEGAMNAIPMRNKDFLDDAGKWFLATVDLRWVIVSTVVFIVVFWVVLKLVKKRSMSREDVISLGQALLNLSSAPHLFCLLVLSHPPRI